MSPDVSGGAAVTSVLDRAIPLALTLALAATACGGRTAAVASPTPEPTASAPTAPASSTSAASPSSPIVASRELTFVAFATGERFRMQTDPAARDFGHFVYSLPGRGSYSGFVDGAVRVAPSELAIDYSGPATFIASASDMPTATAAPARTVTVHLEARLDPVTHTGTITLTHDGVALTMMASIPSVADLDPVILTFEQAMVTGDASSLYAVMNSDVTSAYTPAAFAQQWAAGQAQNGTVAALRRLRSSAPQLADWGFWLVSVEYEADQVSPAGAHSVARYDAYFVRERTGWKVLSTTQR